MCPQTALKRTYTAGSAEISMEKTAGFKQSVSALCSAKKISMKTQGSENSDIASKIKF